MKRNFHASERTKIKAGEIWMLNLKPEKTRVSLQDKGEGQYSAFDRQRDLTFHSHECPGKYTALARQT